MQLSLSLIGTICLTIGFTSAQSSATEAETTTITVTPGCPTAVADVIVTRSDVVAPASCAAGNGTTPLIVSTSVYGVNATATAGGSSTSTSTGGLAQFTGAAAHSDATGAMAIIVGGVVVALLA